MKIQLSHSYNDIVSLENLLLAWEEFIRGKRKRKDVQQFSFSLMDNIFSLHRNLSNHTYKHGSYQAFNINDPKPRDIHKASVRDRLLHHAIYRILYPLFDKTFIADSYSCRIGKGTHKAINKFRSYFYKVSQNSTCACWVLKCDIRKFFANIDHEILIKILSEYIPDKNILRLLGEVIGSFSTKDKVDVGLPLGNLTSQLFVNVYMNKFDQHIKHRLKARFYVRYADDFVILSHDKKWLESLIPQVAEFLKTNLKLEMHPNKISIKTFSSGVDFLGAINFLDHLILRTKTKRRMFKKLLLKHTLFREKLTTENSFSQSLQSYLGILSHVNGNKIEREIFIQTTEDKFN